MTLTIDNTKLSIAIAFALMVSLPIVQAETPSTTEVASTENTTPDLEREQRLADEMVDSIMDGDAVMLPSSDHEFVGIYTEAEDSKGTVIILHGRGFHPDWMDAIQPIRVGLAEQGWSTLSLQMPVLEKSAKYYDYVPIFPASHERIEAGIKYAKEQSDKPVIIFAHSCGAHMAMSWIREKGDGDIAAYIGAGMGATDYKQYMAEPFPLDSMTVPVLDLYGSDEYPAVAKMAPDRLKLIEKAGNTQSAQKIVEGADHYFTDKGDELTETVLEWLDSLTL